MKSKRGNFRINFPPFTVKETKIIQIIDGEKIAIYSYSLNTQDKNDENLGYTINYSFWPNITTDELIDKKLDIEADKVVSSLNIVIEYENIIDTLSYPGRELFLTIDRLNIKIKYRIYFINGTLYKLVVITEDGKIFNKSVSRFLNSFEVLHEQKTIRKRSPIGNVPLTLDS